MNIHGEGRHSADAVLALRRAFVAVCVFCAAVAAASMLQQHQVGSGLTPPFVSSN
jgi:hypothetical protein